MMVSATLSTSTTSLTKLLRGGREPTILDLTSEEQAEEQKLEHYVLRTSEDDRFLLIYAIFKLQLIKGKVIVFVGGDEKTGGAVDRCYRVQLFLEQFGVRSVVLNQDMPVNSRQHVVEEFNRGVYNIALAADEAEVIGNDKRKKRRMLEQEEEADNDDDDEASKATLQPAEAVEENVEDDKTTSPQSKQTKPRKRHGIDPEYTPTRGIDFRRVARHDEEVLESIKIQVAKSGGEIKEWKMDMTKLEAFRYRFADALRSVTRIAVREARTRELRNELINSTKLQRRFEENPAALIGGADIESHARAGLSFQFRLLILQDL
ncbi:P-loop containing nucleoside triphosphate hydrolase protein [Colletotrichum sp. SAR 10_71]|nr:P-loop containing nucleoside triphosphate hydrolase protein [Colletotrichum sp. SAR 10_71]KAJ4994880.1 P-loop containing nucleoside triphosphate hydrolase protein [Colletotrichum sp. SAR 10_66]